MHGQPVNILMCPWHTSTRRGLFPHCLRNLLTCRTAQALVVPQLRHWFCLSLSPCLCLCLSLSQNQSSNPNSSMPHGAEPGACSSCPAWEQEELRHVQFRVMFGTSEIHSNRLERAGILLISEGSWVWGNLQGCTLGPGCPCRYEVKSLILELTCPRVIPEGQLWVHVVITTTITTQKEEKRKLLQSQALE